MLPRLLVIPPLPSFSALLPLEGGRTFGETRASAVCFTLPLRLKGLILSALDSAFAGSVFVRACKDGLLPSPPLSARLAAVPLGVSFASLVLGLLGPLGTMFIYAELGVEVSVGSGDFSIGDRGSDRSDWLLDIRRKSCCVL